MPLTSEPQKLSDFFSGHVRKARRFSFEDAPSPDVPLIVVGGGHELCSPSYAIRRDGFPFYCVEFVARGRGWLTLNGRRHCLEAGTIFSYGPGVAQHITTDARDPLDKFFLDFTGPRAPQALCDHGLAPGAVARVSSVSEIEDVFETLIRDGSQGSSAANSLCVALWEYLLIKLSDLMLSPGTPPSAAAATFQRCRQYINNHFRRLRSLEQIAGECGIDQAYLCRLFRRFGHQAPYRYLLRLKMNFAADQLRDSRKLVKEVAANVGFDDPFQFSHAFKNVLGTSPDFFRRLDRPERQLAAATHQ